MVEAHPAGHPDAKARRLDALLADFEDTPRVVFTQYTETAEQLFERLRFGRVAVLHGRRAAIASGGLSRRAVLERFAPRAMNCSPPSQHERIATLISTDVLSEGLDLQDAQHCISYDLPWNPVRLMQRIGRIDRMHSPHGEVFSWYFTPGPVVEDLLRLMRRLRLKIRTIEAAIGSETPVLTPASRKLRREWRAPRPCAEVFGRLRVIAEEHGCVVESGETLVAQVRCSRPAGRVAVMSLRAGRYGWWEAVDLECQRPDARAISETEIAGLLLAVHEEGFRRVANLTDALQPAMRALVLRRRLMRNSPVVRDACVSVATLIRKRLAHIPGGASTGTCRTAERLLQRLQHGLPVAQERALGALLRRAPGDAATLLAEINAIAGVERTRTESPRVTAILIVEGTAPG
jgi:hypothetical protein